MRDLTEAEVTTIYNDAKCPFCGSKDFYEGPSGGMSINWFCADCGAGFNLTPFKELRGQLIKEPVKAK